MTNGTLVATPPQDYDDNYSIAYATRYNGFIVSNDMFRDYLMTISPDNQAQLKERLISFTFRNDEFLPNPGASYFKLNN